MNKTTNMYTDTEKSIPESVFEQQQNRQKQLTKLLKEIETELKEICVGIDRADDLITSANNRIASANEEISCANNHIACANEQIATANDLISSATATRKSAVLEKKLLSHQMKELQEDIKKAKTKREEVANYWDGLINEHIRKRCTCGRCYRQKVLPSKSSRKRLNKNGPGGKLGGKNEKQS